MTLVFQGGGFIPSYPERNYVPISDAPEIIIPLPKQRWYSQGREDKIAARIFRIIGTTNRVAVEFGALDGTHGSNTAHFRDRGWTVHLFDQAPLSPIVTRADITAENVNRVFESVGVPYAFDLLSLDIDGNDLWVWEAMNSRPRVVIIEFNPKWPPEKSRTVPYDPLRRWDRSNFYGASVRALCKLGSRKGYQLVAATRNNLIFCLRTSRLDAMAPEDVDLTKKQKRRDPMRRKWVVYR